MAKQPFLFSVLPAAKNTQPKLNREFLGGLVFPMSLQLLKLKF